MLARLERATGMEKGARGVTSVQELQQLDSSKGLQEDGPARLCEADQSSARDLGQSSNGATLEEEKGLKSRALSSLHTNSNGSSMVASSNEFEEVLGEDS